MSLKVGEVAGCSGGAQSTATSKGASLDSLSVYEGCLLDTWGGVSGLSSWEETGAEPGHIGEIPTKYRYNINSGCH